MKSQSAPVTDKDITVDSQGISSQSAPPLDQSAPPLDQSAPPLDQSAPPLDQSAPPLDQSAPPQGLNKEIPDQINELLDKLGKKSDVKKVNEVIIQLCRWHELSSAEIANILNKSEKHVLRKYITPLRLSGKIEYTIPDMENHPNQAYKA